MKYTTDQYNEIFEKLPQEVKDVVASFDTTKRLWAIGEKHRLQIDKVGVMHDLAMDVMMGIVASKNFVKELTNGLIIPALDASAIARDIDEEIFKPIKTTMVKLYGEGAPYKPSSSLVQFYEEDDEHKELDKSALLREIEDPVAVTPRIEKVVTTSTMLETMEEVSALKIMESKAGTSMEVPPRETPKAPIEVVPKKEEMIAPEPVLPKEEVRLSMLDKIASMKLSQTFVMPKGSEEINKIGNSEPDTINSKKELINNPFLEEKKAPPPPKLTEDKPFVSAVAKPDSTPYTPPAPKSYASDPYREPLA